MDVDKSCWELDCLYLGYNDANGLNKSVLKPISKYKNLFVNRIPKTFSKKEVFRNVLDQNISTYILSPLDQNLSYRLFECKKCATKRDLNDHLNVIINEMIGNQHFKKCLSYVRRNSCNRLKQDKTLEEAIINDYKDLIKDIGHTLFEIKRRIG